MKKLVIGVIIGLAVGFTVGFGISANSQAKTAVVAPKPPTIAGLLMLVNADRAKHGVAPLKEDARLDASAQYKASDEVARNYFGHKDPVTGKNNGLDVANTLTGTTCVWVSENLVDNVYEGTNTPDSNTSAGSVDSWINSKPHHKAMIDPKYTLTGFGISGTQVVEHFCQQ